MRLKKSLLLFFWISDANASLEGAQKSNAQQKKKQAVRRDQQACIAWLEWKGKVSGIKPEKQGRMLCYLIAAMELGKQAILDSLEKKQDPLPQLTPKEHVELCAYLREYIAYLHLSQDAYQGTSLFLEAIQGDHYLFELELRQAYKTFQKKEETILGGEDQAKLQQTRAKVSDAVLPEDVAYHRSMYELISLEQRQAYGSSRERNDTLVQSLLHHFDQWWMLEKLELASFVLNHQRLYPAKPSTGESPETSERFPLRLLPELLEEIKQNPQLNRQLVLHVHGKVVSFLLKGNMVLEQQEEQEVQEIFDHLRRHRQAVGERSLRNLLFLLINHYMRLYTLYDDPSYADMLRHLYTWGLEQDALMVGGKLHWKHLKGLVHVCLQTGRRKEAQTHFKNLLPKLDFIQQSDAKIFNNAYLDYFKGDYQKAISSFYSHTFNQKNYTLSGRILAQQARYLQWKGILDPQRRELQQKIMNAEGDALEAYIAYNFEPEDLKGQAYKNFNRFFSRLVGIRYLGSVERLMGDLNEEKLVTQRNWLIKQTSERLNGSHPA